MCPKQIEVNITLVQNNELRGDILRKAMEEDRRNGLHPFFVCTTLGTTGRVANSSLQVFGSLLKKKIFLNSLRNQDF